MSKYKLIDAMIVVIVNNKTPRFQIKLKDNDTDLFCYSYQSYCLQSLYELTICYRLFSNLFR